MVVLNCQGIRRQRCLYDPWREGELSLFDGVRQETDDLAEMKGITHDG